MTDTNIYEIKDQEIEVLTEFRKKLQDYEKKEVYADIYDISDKDMKIRYSFDKDYKNFFEEISLNRQTLKWDFV